MKHRATKPERTTPPEVLREVCLRAGGRWIHGQCFGGKCEVKGHVETHDGRGLCFAHYPKHRKMGGTTSPEVHSADNILRSCFPCHDRLDNRAMESPQPIDNRPCPLLGRYGPYSRSMQVGHKVKGDE